jgi:hypothetical protein
MSQTRPEEPIFQEILPQKGCNAFGVLASLPKSQRPFQLPDTFTRSLNRIRSRSSKEWRRHNGTTNSA